MKKDREGFILCDCGHRLNIKDEEGKVAECPECQKTYIFRDGCLGAFIFLAISIEEVVRVIVA